MIKVSSGRQLVVAVMAALAVVLFAPGLGVPTPSASADVGSVSVSDTTVLDDAVVSVTVSAQDDDGPLVVTAGSANEVISNITCTASPCGTTTLSGTNGFSMVTSGFDADLSAETISVSFSLTVNCDNTVGENVVVSATQDGDTNTRTIVCGDPNADTDITISKQANYNTNDAFPFTFSVTGGTCTVVKSGTTVGTGSSGSFTLSDNQSVSIDCSDNAVLTVREEVEADLVDVIGCGSEAGVTEGSRSVRITVADADANVHCTFVNERSVSTNRIIQVVSNNLAPACGTSVTLTATVIEGTGLVAANGTVVTFSATPGGSFNQTSVATVNGIASVVLTTPVNFNNVLSITVTAGSAVTVGQLRVYCQAPVVVVSPPAPPPTVQPTTPPPAQTGGTIVSPPRAGEAGLASTSSPFNWMLFAGIILAATVSMGAAMVVQREKAES